MIFTVFFLLALSVSGGLAYAESGMDLVRHLQTKITEGKQVDAAVVYAKLGELTQIHGAFPAAETNSKKSIDLFNRYAPPNDLHLVTALDDLGWLYITWGKYVDGSRIMDLARTKAEGAQPNDPSLIRHLDCQAAYQVVAGKVLRAQKNWNGARWRLEN